MSPFFSQEQVGQSVIAELEQVKTNDKGKSVSGPELISYRVLETMTTEDELSKWKEQVLQGYYMQRDAEGNAIILPYESARKLSGFEKLMERSKINWDRCKSMLKFPLSQLELTWKCRQR